MPNTTKEAVKAAQIAPTAKNQQPWRMYVIQSESALAKLSELTHCAYGAKTVLLFTYKTGEVWQNPLEEGVHSGIEDVSIAATHAMLEATEQGLNTCWCNSFSNSKIESAFNLPADEKIRRPYAARLRRARCKARSHAHGDKAAR